MRPSPSGQAPSLSDRANADDDSSTRERLIFAAIGLSAERPLRDIAVRDIYLKAGVRNGSAIRYYFGDKEGFVRAVAETLYGEAVEPVETRLIELKNRAQREPVTVREVIEACFAPSLSMVLKSQFGLDAARANTWFFGDENPEIQKLFASAIDRRVKIAGDLLEPLVPGKRRAIIEAELRMSITMVLHLTQDAFTYNRVSVEPTHEGIAESNKRVLDYLTNAFLGRSTAGRHSWRRSGVLS